MLPSMLLLFAVPGNIIVLLNEVVLVSRFFKSLKSITLEHCLSPNLIDASPSENLIGLFLVMDLKKKK